MIIISVVSGLFLVAVVVGLFRMAWDYDKRDNISVGHYEKFGQVWVSHRLEKRNGKVVFSGWESGEGDV